MKERRVTVVNCPNRYRAGRGGPCSIGCRGIFQCRRGEQIRDERRRLERRGDGVRA